jgi:hypothetical protein
MFCQFILISWTFAIKLGASYCSNGNQKERLFLKNIYALHHELSTAEH